MVGQRGRRPQRLTYHDPMTAAVPDDYGSDPKVRTEAPMGGPLDLQRAWQKMAGGAPVVVDVLYHIALHSENDSTRVQAALGILKMGGFGQNDVTVRVVPAQFDQAAGLDDGKASAAQRIEDRFAKLREATYAVTVDEDDSEVVDAVIVEDE